MRTILSWVLVFNLLLLGEGVTSLRPRSPALRTADYVRFNAEIERLQRRLLIPGIALAVFNENGLIFERGDGYAVVGGAQFSSKTLFPIASLTKTMAAIRIFQLVQNHQISLRDTVSKYTAAKDLAPETTVSNLLSHTSDPPPGTRFLYSGHLYGRLATIIEAAGRAPFTSQLTSDVLGAAQMTSTYANLRNIPLSVASTRLAKP